MRGLFTGGLLSLLLFTAAPKATFAADGHRAVVITVRSKGARGASELRFALDRELTSTLGPLLPQAAVDGAQRLCKRTAKTAARDDINALASAARKAGADYALCVELGRNGWQFVVRTLLVDADLGEVKMDFRTGYFAPREVAPARGIGIARKVIAKLRELQALPPAPEP